MIGKKKLERMRLCFDLLPRPGESVALELYDEIIEMRLLLEDILYKQLSISQISEKIEQFLSA